MGMITIGAVMPLVPGVPLTNAVRDVLAGHILSGISRGTEALISACAIGFGIAVFSEVSDDESVFIFNCERCFLLHGNRRIWGYPKHPATRIERMRNRRRHRMVGLCLHKGLFQQLDACQLAGSIFHRYGCHVLCPFQENADDFV